MARDLTESPEPDRLGDWPHPREAVRMIGHERAEQTLLRAVNSRLPHAWIFGGLKGIGKATLAYRFARALLARGQGAQALASLDSDPQSPTVRRILANAHPDLMILRRPVDPKTGKLKSELPVDEARRLGDFFSRHSDGGGHRIAIVDSADELNRNAANALLKTLEEPPPGGVLILIAHRPRALLPTIRSRCRMLTMNPLTVSEVGETLNVVAPDIENAAALAEASGGSVGAALELAAHGGLALDSILQAIARKRGRDVSAAHTLANELALAAAEPRFQLFLSRIQAAFADAAEHGSRPALEAWQMTAELARAEAGLNIDKRSIVLRLLDRYGEMARVE